LHFDKAGWFIKVEFLQLSQTTAVMASQRDQREGFCQRASDEIDGIFVSECARKCPVQVHRFFLEDYIIGIRDLPEYFAKLLSNPLEYPADDYSIGIDTLARWKNEGIFEFWLADGLWVWLNKDGKVEFT
jgi:hypothetical protein